MDVKVSKLRKAKMKLLDNLNDYDKADEEMIEFLKYCQALPFDAKPDYEYLKDLLSKLREKVRK